MCNVEINFGYTPLINFSMQQNHVPVVREIVIKNTSDTDLSNLCIRISFEPEFAQICEIHIDVIPTHGDYNTNTIPIIMSTDFLSNLTERVLGQINVAVLSDEEVLYENSYKISVLAYDQWCGLAVLPEMLSAFVTPNHPGIAPILKKASEYLDKWTGSPSFDAYQTRDPNRVKKQMAAIYEAITEQQIAYCSVPASFEEYGQRIRLYDNVLTNKLATCLDMALLYAGCLEAVGIHPLIIVTQGHAFSGGWLIADSFADSVNDDVALLTKRTVEGINEIMLVETTCMNDSGISISFDSACETANNKLVNSEDFVLFIDITRARFAQIRPLPLRVATENGFSIIEEDELKERVVANPVTMSASDIITDTSNIQVGKQTIWERKLLDISLRNNLLNTRISQSTLQLISVGINKIEDALSDGEEFQVLSKPLDWDNPHMSANIYQALNASDPIIDLIKQELSQKRLRSYLDEDALERSLTHLYRSSRLSLEENGANTLYLALGLLKWYESHTSTKPRFAPILLLPIEIVRKSAAKGYVIRSRGEETIMNITLIEMLRQFYGINIGGLEILPHDEIGVDVPRVFNIVRRAIMTQKGWDVKEQAIIGNFSFNKFIMWHDIHNNSEILCHNKIVASLMSGKIEWDVETQQSSNVDLDKKYNVEDIALPIVADSSQLRAICDAVDNKSFILHGPPGTGKSQTITNIIANALYKGKKVLFVAEKMAALQVVQKRLETIGLAPFCLELHSNKTKKTSILEQLKRTTEVTKQKSSKEFAIEAEQINNIRKDLNGYVNTLHKVYPSGLSLYDCFAGYAFYDNVKKAIELPSSFLSQLTAKNLSDDNIVIEEYETATKICGNPSRHPLYGINISEYNQDIKAVVTQALNNTFDLIVKYKASLKTVLKIIDVNCDKITPRQHTALTEIAKLLLNATTIPICLLEGSNTSELFEQIDNTVIHGIKRNELREKILSKYEASILKLDADSIRMQWQKTSAKWCLPKIIGQNKILSMLAIYSKNKCKPQKELVVELLDNILSYQTEQKQIDSNSPTLSIALKNLWNNGECDWQKLLEGEQCVEKLIEQITLFTQDITESSNLKSTLSTKLSEGLSTFKDLYSVQIISFIDAHNLLFASVDKLQTILNSTFLTNNSMSDLIGTLEMAVVKWRDNLDKLRDWVMYIQERNKLVSIGLEAVVSAVEDGDVLSQNISICYRKGLYKSYAEYILSCEPQMNSFHGKLFEDKIVRFKNLCKSFEYLTRKELYAKLASSLPALQKEAAQSSEVGILQRNIRNGGRGTSIRKLFDMIPDLLTRMCPCMLMSPISVAQYIDAGSSKFDMVIFDEASQVPTCEAVGAIARGKNVIVVGDPKQMPPTNFFVSNTYDEDNVDKEDLESILDDCLALSMPSKYLIWHYRSKHESLIAFSNAKYYDNKLLTFPSPDDLATKVSFQYVNGIYDRGRSRQNLAEAEAVIAEIKLRLSNPDTAKRSIGVVTFNTNQQSLIEDLLNDMFRDNPDLETIALDCEEQIFIKNLENVQGDERDVILFSVGYGVDKDGKIALNFGPLNREGGWRRLNVAVSRARYEMRVFSTLLPEQIDLNRTSAAGVAGLKAFLDYAENGRDSLILNTASEKRSDDAFLNSIAKELKENGYNVHINIGCSGYRVDIGVIDPHDSNKYVLGILCDGYNYCTAKTAYDRYVTQVSVLKMLGWRLYHLWSMDWWENRNSTMDSLVQSIEDAIAGKPEKILFEKEPILGDYNAQMYNTDTSDISLWQALGKLDHAQMNNSDTSDISSQNVEKIVESTNTNTDEENGYVPDCNIEKYSIPYTTAKLEIKCISSDDIALGYYDDLILDRIYTVVEVEAPISKGLLCKRVLNSLCISRMGSRLSVYMEDMLSKAHLNNFGQDKSFYWNANQIIKNYTTYRCTSLREALDIAPEEVTNALLTVLMEQGSLSKEDLIRETAHKFFYYRMGDNVVFSMSRGISNAIQRGMVKQESGRIRLNGYRT